VHGVEEPVLRGFRTFPVISHPVARSAPSERKLSGRGEPPPPPESELGFPIFVWPNSVRVTAPQRYPMLQRNLLYTGLTRGKRLIVLVGQKKVIAIAVRKTGALLTRADRSAPTSAALSRL
jgi:hypothetical protein